MFLFGNEKVSGVPLAPRALSGMRSGELMPCCTCSPVTFQNEINVAPWKSTRFRGQIRLPTVRKKRETQREGELNRHDCQIKKNTHTHTQNTQKSERVFYQRKGNQNLPMPIQRKKNYRWDKFVLWVFAFYPGKCVIINTKRAQADCTVNAVLIHFLLIK